MKLIIALSTILIALFSNMATAQNAVMGESSFGIYGGVNFQNINGKDAADTKLENDLVTRFHIGLNYEIPIAPEFYFQPGLQFISKGAKGPVPYTYTDITGNQTVTIDRNINMNYLEVPLNFVYKPLVGSGHFILGFGPYVGYAIGGKAKYSGSLSPAESDITFTKTAPGNDPNSHLAHFKPWDVGGNFFFGYQFLNGFNVIFNAQLGLIKINSDSSSKLSYKNTGFGLSLGYRF